MICQTRLLAVHLQAGLVAGLLMALFLLCGCGLKQKDSDSARSGQVVADSGTASDKAGKKGQDTAKKSRARASQENGKPGQEQGKDQASGKNGSPANSVSESWGAGASGRSASDENKADGKKDNQPDKDGKGEQASDESADFGLQGDPVPYKVVFLVDGALAASAESGDGQETDKAGQGDSDPSGEKNKEAGKEKARNGKAGDKPDLSFLADKMKKASQLVLLKKEPPDSILGLELRARSDVQTAIKLLHSQCFYEGTADFAIDESTSPATVTISLKPGPRYHLGKAKVAYEPEPVIPQAFNERTTTAGFFGQEIVRLPGPEFPADLPGVKPGEPIVADDMLAAVDALPAKLHKQGYPLAKLVNSVYTLDPASKILNAQITIEPGPPARLGEVRFKNNKEVNTGYLARLVPWQSGQVDWDDTVLHDYANHLRQTGLFRQVEAVPRPEEMVWDKDGVAVIPVEVSVEEAAFRTIGASAQYATDTGFGVEGSWEHRNFFNNGEKFSAVAPIATQTQGLKLALDKPAFFVREQSLQAKLEALREDTSAYEKKTGSGYLGLERKLSKFWKTGGGITVEYGTMKTSEESEKAFGLVKPAAYLRRDSRNNENDTSAGSDIKLEISPFAGTYQKDFSALSGKISASFFYAPRKKESGLPDDKLVLAARVEAGAMSGSRVHDIPASLRYFAGGAGSVRGYVHQSIGPRDSKDEPLGGRSYQNFSLEARYKLTENIGVVPFIDGGMVWEDEIPRIFANMDLGAGLGLRYYTPIGPVRLDVATPLNPIDGDPPVQFYISIGQAF